MSDARLPINHGDTGKVSRDKINDSFNEVVQTVISYRPHIENGYWWIGNTNTGIRAVGTKLQDENNLIKLNSSYETYVDLQFQDGLTPTSTFSIGVTVGNVSSTDGREADGILVNNQTDDSYARLLYGDDGKLYFDGGLGVFKSIATTSDLTTALASLRSELSTVAFTGKSSDLNNDADFSSVPVMTYEEREDLPGTSGDDKRYLIYETEN